MQKQDDLRGNAVFDQWTFEHQVIDRFTVNLTEWIAAQSKLRCLQLRQTVEKLRELKEQLQSHFEREEEICRHLKTAHRDCSLDAEAMQRQTDRDQSGISARLKHLIDRMQEAEFEMDSWKKGVQELGLIIDLIEQHDEQQSESISSLLPRVSL